MLYYRKRSSVVVPSGKLGKEQIPASLRNEIVGQNRVNAKKQSLVNHEYFRFVDQLLQSKQPKQPKQSKSGGNSGGNSGGSNGTSGNITPPMSAQLTQYNVLFVLSAFVHSGKDMLMCIEGTPEYVARNNKEGTEGKEGKEGTEGSNNDVVSPLSSWHRRLSEALIDHPDVAAWCLTTLMQSMKTHSFLRMFKYTESYTESYTTTTPWTMDRLAKAIVEQCVVVCTTSATHQAAVHEFIVHVCTHLVQWGRRTSDGERSLKERKENGGNSGNGGSRALVVLDSGEWNSAKHARQLWLRGLCTLYATHTNQDTTDLFALATSSSSTSPSFLSSMSQPLTTSTLNCITALLRHCHHDTSPTTPPTACWTWVVALCNHDNYMHARSAAATTTMLLALVSSSTPTVLETVLETALETALETVLDI